MNFDFLIKGGLVFDGSQSDACPRLADIGLKGDRIEAVGNLSVAYADKVINAEGFCICPGFIDAHAHSEFTILADGRAEGKICQGITTEINGNCGLSAAPLYGEALEQRLGEIKQLGIKERWSSFSEYFAFLNKKGIATNFLTLVGHGNIRASAAGYADRRVTAEEKHRMNGFLKDALDSGAQGISTGLIYPPGLYSDTSEIIDLAKEAVKHNAGIYATHMRSEGDKLLEALDEAIKIGIDSKIRVHVSHLKTSGEKNWNKIQKVFEKIHNARQKGLILTCDRYPYTAGGTDLDSVLPSWVYEGGRSEELKRLKNPKIHEQIKKEIFHEHPDEDYWRNIIISYVGKKKNKWMEGKSLFEIGRLLNEASVEVLFKILIEEDLRVDAIFFSMNEENLKSILKLPYSVIGSDSSARSFDGITAKGKPHPRGFGSFPRVLSRYVMEQGIISQEEAIYKMTGLPAKIFGIHRRGIIKEDFFADITVFDFNSIKDKASFDNPFHRPEGVHYVFVNGIPALWESRLTGALSGKILD
ncbi:MAG: D-aminoacylase [Nitrospirota bacterium]